MRTIRFPLIALSALAALFSLPIRAQDQQQSTDPVADAARKARAQKAAASKPKHVITNDDIPSAPPPTAGTDAKSGKTAAQDASAAPKEDPEENPKSESYWRKKFSRIHAKLAQAEKERDILQREFEQDQVQYYPDPQKALLEQNNRGDIKEKKSKLDAKLKEIENLKQSISDLEDDLPKAGGDPGWSR
jgi:chromosome segregation ATPase